MACNSHACRMVQSTYHKAYSTSHKVHNTYHNHILGSSSMACNCHIHTSHHKVYSHTSHHKVYSHTSHHKAYSSHTSLHNTYHKAYSTCHMVHNNGVLSLSIVGDK